MSEAFVFGRQSSSLPSAQCRMPSQYFSIGKQFPSTRQRNSFSLHIGRCAGQFSSSSPAHEMKKVGILEKLNNEFAPFLFVSINKMNLTNRSATQQFTVCIVRIYLPLPQSLKPSQTYCRAMQTPESHLNSCWPHFSGLGTSVVDVVELSSFPQPRSSLPSPQSFTESQRHC